MRTEADRSLSFPSAPRRAVAVGLLGCGVVGSEVARMLAEGGIAAAAGVPVHLERVAVRRPARPRPIALDPAIVTTDALGVAADPRIDVVVEVIGGTDPALACAHAALGRGAPLVTANKELLANHGDLLFAAAGAGGAEILFEAAAGGAVPIVRALRHALAGDRVMRLSGVLNGTTNFVLSRMETGTASFDALDTARRLGYAEEDPQADVDGRDAAAKAAILASLAFGVPVTLADVAYEGIGNLSTSDLTRARRRGRAIRLVARAERGSGAPRVSVGPEELRIDHPLARLDGARNGVVVEAERAGTLFFSGPGAGGAPTASAVAADIVEAIRHLLHRTTTEAPREEATA